MLTRADIDYIEDDNSAARAFLELQHTLAQPGLPAGQRTEAKAALNKLQREWPGVADHAAIASDDDLGGLSAGLKRTRDSHRRSRGTTAKAAATTRAKQRREQAGGRPKPGPKKPAPTRPVPRSRRASRRSSLGLWARTGLPGAADSATGLLLQLFGFTIGLTLVYVLTTGRGPRAVTIAAGSFEKGLRLFLAPVDPLAPIKPGSAYTTDPKAPKNAPAPTTALSPYERAALNGTVAGPVRPGAQRAKPVTPMTSPSKP